MNTNRRVFFRNVGMGAVAVAGLPARYPVPQFQRAAWPTPSQRARQVSRALDACLVAVDAIQSPDAHHNLTSLQLFLLRRLSLDRLIRWHRDRDPDMLSDAAASAREIISDLGRLVP